MKNKPVIAFKNVFFSFDKLSVIKHGNFKIFPNEFIGIIGPNGGGKTTALKLMLGFLKPQKGMISILNRFPKQARCFIGYVPQTKIYDKQFPISVLEFILTGALSQLSFFGRYPKIVYQKAKDLLFLFDLKKYQDFPFSSLSGGQAQKALLARALIGNPKILLLDEPTANIDAQTEKQIFTFLKKLKKTKTILMVTHNFDAILKNVDRVLCFQNEISSMKPENVCNHFSLGIYHKKVEMQHG